MKRISIFQDLFRGQFRELLRRGRGREHQGGRGGAQQDAQRFTQGKRRTGGKKK